MAHLGRSSVTYEVGVFKSSGEGGATSASEDEPAAVGGYTHVFVDKHSRKSVAINVRTKDGLQKLATTSTGQVPLRGAKL